MSIAYASPAQILAPSIHNPPAALLVNVDNEEFPSVAGVGTANGGVAVGPPAAWKALREDTMANITPLVGINSYLANSTLNDARWEVGYRPSCLTWQPCNANGGAVSGNQWFYKPLLSTLTNSGVTKWDVSCSLKQLFANMIIPNVASDGLCIFALAPDNGSGKPDLSQNWVGVRLDALIAGSGNWKVRFEYKQAGSVVDVSSGQATRQLSNGGVALPNMDRFGLVYGGAAGAAGAMGAYFGNDSSLQWLSNNGGSLLSVFGGSAITFAYFCVLAKCDVGSGMPQSFWHLDYVRRGNGRLP